MKTSTTVLSEAANLEAALEKVESKHLAARIKLNAKHEAACDKLTAATDKAVEETYAAFSPEAVALFEKLQSEKAKVAEGKAS